MKRLDQRFSHDWHVEINKLPIERRKENWMYEAKTMADEVPRLVELFKAERIGALPKTHRQCSQSEPEPIPENYLFCCLGVRCRECDVLTALDNMEAKPEEIDVAKAWTCAGHIVSQGGDVAREGYVLRVDDRMYWDRVYENLSTELSD